MIDGVKLQRARGESRNRFVTYLAVLDAPHSTHGCEAADERAALLLHAVGLHLYPGKHVTTNSAKPQSQRPNLAPKRCFH